MTASHDNAVHDERAAAILARRASGLIAHDEVLAELADADCGAALAALVAERVRLDAALVLRALEADDDQPISVMCRAAGFRINSYSALLRMRRRQNRGTGSAPAYALTFFSDLSPASAERRVRRLTGEPAERHT